MCRGSNCFLYFVFGIYWVCETRVHIFLNRSAEDMECYSNECVPVTSESLEQAVDWLWKLERIAPVSTTGTCEAVVKAMNDPQVQRLFNSDKFTETINPTWQRFPSF